MTRDFLLRKAMRDITAVEIADACVMSVATFYIYFDDVPSAAFALLREIYEASPDLSGHFVRPWQGAAGKADARAFVMTYMDYFVSHYALISICNILADEGDPRFAELRAQHAVIPMKGLSAQVATAGRLDRTPSDADLHQAQAVAGLLLGMVDRLCVVSTMLRQHPYKARGLTRPSLVTAGTRILLSAVRDGLEAID